MSDRVLFWRWLAACACAAGLLATGMWWAAEHASWLLSAAGLAAFLGLGYFTGRLSLNLGGDVGEPASWHYGWSFILWPLSLPLFLMVIATEWALRDRKSA